MMSNVSMQFPDGSVREYNAATTGAELAESISKSLAKKARAGAFPGNAGNDRPSHREWLLLRLRA